MAIPAALVQAFCTAIGRLDDIRHGENDDPLVRWSDQDCTVSAILQAVAEYHESMPYGVLILVLGVPGVRRICDATYSSGARSLREVYNSVFRMRKIMKDATP
jgi:hypothetical protein